MSTNIKLPEDARDKERLSRALASLFEHPAWAEVETYLIGPNVEKERVVLGQQDDEKQIFRAQGRMAVWDGLKDLVKRTKDAIKTGRTSL